MNNYSTESLLHALEEGRYAPIHLSALKVGGDAGRRLSQSHGGERVSALLEDLATQEQFTPADWRDLASLALAYGFSRPLHASVPASGGDDAAPTNDFHSEPLI